MRLIATALLASAVATPAAAADLSFIFFTTAAGPSVYASGSGKITIDEASGVNGRFKVTDAAGSYIAGILQQDNTLTNRSESPLTSVSSDSFISFAPDGSVEDFGVGLRNGDELFEISLINVASGTFVGISGVGNYRARISIEGLVPPGIQPPAVPEPATWAMMIGGFGLVGGAMRRGRQTRIVSCA